MAEVDAKILLDASQQLKQATDKFAVATRQMESMQFSQERLQEHQDKLLAEIEKINARLTVLEETLKKLPGLENDVENLKTRRTEKIEIAKVKAPANVETIKQIGLVLLSLLGAGSILSSFVNSLRIDTNSQKIKQQQQQDQVFQQRDREILQRVEQILKEEAAKQDGK